MSSASDHGTTVKSPRPFGPRLTDGKSTRSVEYTRSSNLRTLPQMNALLLGFQVKAMLLLVTLPLSVAFAGALFLRIIRVALAAPPSWWGTP